MPVESLEKRKGIIMKKNMSRRNFVGVGAVAAASLMLPGCASDGGDTTEQAAEETATEATTEEAASEEPKPLTKIRMAYGGAGHITTEVAMDQGYLAEEGVEVEFVQFENNVDCFAGVFSDKVDVLASQGTNMPLQQIGSGNELVIFGRYMMQGCMPIVAKTGTKWNGPEDLLGKTLASSGNEYAVMGPLLDAGHDPLNEINLMVLNNHADRLEAVRAGEADYAIVGTSQNYNVSQMDDLEVMAYESDVTPNYSCCVADCSAEFLANNRDALKGLLRAWLRALSFYNRNKDYCIELNAKNVNSPKEYIEIFANNDHYKMMVDPGRSVVDRAWNWMGELGFLDEGWENINLDDHIDISLYEEALEEVTAAHGDEDPEFYEQCAKDFAELNA